MRKIKAFCFAIAGSVLSAVLCLPARADVNVGIILATTGPGAAIGIPEKNAAMLGPAQIAGQHVNYLFLDDASDPTTAVTNFRKLASESHVDVVIGASNTPSAFAMTNVAAEFKTPVISMVPVSALVSPVDEKRRWVFKTAPNDEQEAYPLFEHMKASGVKRLALIGFSDPYGDSWAKMTDTFAKERNIQVVATERFARTDTTVIGQVLKIIAAKPDAVLVAGAGAPDALPVIQLREKGYRGPLYGTLGATFGDFRKLAGANGEGIFVPMSAAIAAEQFPDTYPAKRAALAFISAYESKYGKGSRNIFSGSAWDALLLIEHAVPEALKSAQPGTAEFREALRTVIESTRDFPGSRGVYNMSPTDHAGYDQSALVLGQLVKGEWALAH